MTNFVRVLVVLGVLAASYALIVGILYYIVVKLILHLVQMALGG